MKAKIFIMAFNDSVLFHWEDKPTFQELPGWDSELSINQVLNPFSLLASPSSMVSEHWSGMLSEFQKQIHMPSPSG
jgi:hypothetical protein